MSYPTSYDDDSTLLGDLTDQHAVVLLAAVTNAATELLVDSVTLAVPTYLKLDNEVVYATAKNSTDATLTVTRGVLGSTAAAHVNGTAAFLVLTAEHMNILRDRTLATQLYQGLVGLDAVRPASPEVGEIYLATDTKKAYVCEQAGAWVYLGGLHTHAETQAQGETDDHAQYHTQARATAWHNAKGGLHVLDGDNHDHRYGKGAGRINAGVVSARPAAVAAGDTYFSTDSKEWHIALAAASWSKVTGAPTGALVMFTEADLAQYNYACPPGWSRYTAMDGKYPRAAATGITTLGSGGATNHKHTYTAVPTHVHPIPAMNVQSTSAGNHSHTFAFSLTTGGTGLASTSGLGGVEFTSSTAGAHGHTGTYGAVTSGDAKKTLDASAGSSSADTDTLLNTPPYLQVVFCIKD